MDEGNDFYTVTMAKVYADQGHLEKAAEIYRYLLKHEPDRLDLIKSLSEIDKKISERKKKDLKELVPLFSEWIGLMLDFNRLQKLKKLQRKIKNNNLTPKT